MGTNIAKAYADAIYLIGQEDNKTKEYNEELKMICEINENNLELIQVMSSPKINKDEKKELLVNIYKDKIDIHILNFMKLLVDKNHYKELVKIGMLFEKQYYEDEGIAIANVASALELDDMEIEQLKKMLEAKTNKKIIMKVIVDKRVIAGIRVEINGEVMDNTIATKLEKIKNTINNSAL
ncbi:MAG: ATP synthase F1 subunit delta [Erysipelotrichaceae bacterium]